MRLLKFDSEIDDLPFYVIPIEHKFLFEEGTMFDSIVTKFIENFKQPAIEHGTEKMKKKQQRKK